jgi:hypothetical protein
MELGEQSLDDYIKSNAVQLTGDKIWEVAKEIGLAMRDFHSGKVFLQILYYIFYFIINLCKKQLQCIWT